MPINWKNITDPEIKKYVEQNQSHPSFEAHFKKSNPSWFTDEPPAKKTKAAEVSTTNKRPLQSSEVSSSTNAKQAKVAGPVHTIQSTIPSEITFDTEMSLPGTAGADSAMPMVGYTSVQPNTQFPTKMTTYRKSHHFITFGIANTWLSIDVVSPAESQRYLTTSLAEIPWQKLALYMTEAEFGFLTPGAHVKEMRVKIVHRGTRIAFETAGSTTGLATLNQIQNVMYAEGLNKTSWGVNRRYTSFDATQTMVPTASSDPLYTDMSTQYYGYPNNNALFATQIPVHQVGFKTPLFNYFTLATATDRFGGVPPIIEKINMVDGKMTVNQVLTSTKYNPKCGLIRPPLKYNDWSLPGITGTAPNTFPVRRQNVFGTAATLIAITRASDGDNFDASQNNEILRTADQLSSDFGYTRDIEKSQMFVQDAGWGTTSETAQIQPSLHVGVQAIPALTTTVLTGPVNSWTDSQADFDVICEMDVIEWVGSEFPYAMDGTVSAWKQWWRTLQTEVGSTNNLGATYGGLYGIDPILS